MPTLQHTVKVYENLHIGVRIGAGTVDKRRKGVWWARIKFSGQTPVYRSTGISYDNTHMDLIFPEAQSMASL